MSAPLFFRSFFCQSFAEPLPGLLSLSSFYRPEKVRIRGGSVFLGQSGKAIQFAAMECTVLAQSGKAADYLIKSRVDFQEVLIDVQFQTPTPLAKSSIRSQQPRM